MSIMEVAAGVFIGLLAAKIIVAVVAGIIQYFVS